jgi:hypothetical protein
MIAFEHGDMDKLPRHPFAPSLSELEQAVDRRKATLIEKVCSILVLMLCMAYGLQYFAVHVYTV